MTCRIVAGLRAMRYPREIVREATGSTVVIYTCTIAFNMRCSRGVSMASMRASGLPRTECAPLGTIGYLLRSIVTSTALRFNRVSQAKPGTAPALQRSFRLIVLVVARKVNPLAWSRVEVFRPGAYTVGWSRKSVEKRWCLC